MRQHPFGECREGQIPRSLLCCKIDAPPACCGDFDSNIELVHLFYVRNGIATKMLVGDG